MIARATSGRVANWPVLSASENRRSKRREYISPISRRKTVSCRLRSGVTPEPQLMSILPSSEVISASKLPDLRPRPLMLAVSMPTRLPRLATSSFEPLKKPIRAPA